MKQQEILPSLPHSIDAHGPYQASNSMEEKAEVPVVRVRAGRGWQIHDRANDGTLKPEVIDRKKSSGIFPITKMSSILTMSR